MSKSAAPGIGMRSLVQRQRRRVAYRARGDVAKDRLPGVILAALVVLVQLAWGGMLVYLGFHFF